MIGTVIHEQYRILELLGEGGMGVVYRALDTELDREVALKFLKAEGDNQILIRRFRDELRTLAGFNHPNITMLYTSFSWQARPVMVMELVEGEALNRMVERRGPIPAHVSVPLIAQAIAGVGVAHHKGIIHRDLKPANLMLSKGGTVKVMDFGIAKIEDSPGLTRTSFAMGTPFYMAPEQIDPARFGMKTVDARADIYSLGVTLYELLAGKVPFTGPTEFSIHRAHLEETPVPPTTHYPHIPAPIVEAVLRALAKDPRDRFQTAEEFGAALGDVRLEPGFVAPPVQVTPPPLPPAVQVSPPPPSVVTAATHDAAPAALPSVPMEIARPSQPQPARGMDALLNKWFGRTGNPRLAGGIVAVVLLLLLVIGGFGLDTLLTRPPVVTHATSGGGGGGGGGGSGPLESGSSPSIVPQKPQASDPGEITLPTTHTPASSRPGTATAAASSTPKPVSVIAGRWAGSYQSCEDDSRTPAVLDLTESSGTVNGFLSLRTPSGITARCSVAGSFTENSSSLDFSVSACSASGLPTFVSNRYKNLLRLQGKELSGSIEPQSPCMLESFRKM
jgi:serine/threonine protein kinase